MLQRKFYTSWFGSSLVMGAMSFAWHGVVLTDFQFLIVPALYATLAGISFYALAGFVLAYGASHFEIAKRSFSKRYGRSLMMGALLGFLVYLAFLVTGFTFSPAFDMPNLMMDASWQMFEQAVGGATFVGIYSFMTKMEFGNISIFQ